jgi:hypothetical protein
MKAKGKGRKSDFRGHLEMRKGKATFEGKPA